MAAKFTNRALDEPIRWTLRQSHPAKSLSAVREDLKKSNPPQISFFPSLYCQPFHLSACASLWLRPVRAILYTWLTSLRGTDDLYDATLECARGKRFLVWHKIRNYRFRIFNFDAELEWCKFRALTVAVKSLSRVTVLKNHYLTGPPFSVQVQFIS